MTPLVKFGLSDATYGSLENAFRLRTSADKKKSRLAIIVYASVILGIGTGLFFVFPLVNNQAPAAALDGEKPEINIASPSNNITLTGPPSGVTITIRGEAKDPDSGIQKVEVRFISNASKTPYQMANPSSPQNWLSWTMECTFQAPGSYDISAKATDNAGNEQWSTIRVIVLPVS